MSIAEISKHEMDKKREWDAFAKKIESLIRSDFESRDELFNHFVRGRISEKELKLLLSKHDFKLKDNIFSALQYHNCYLRYI